MSDYDHNIIAVTDPGAQAVLCDALYDAHQRIKRNAAHRIDEHDRRFWEHCDRMLEGIMQMLDSGGRVTIVFASPDSETAHIRASED